MSGKQTQPTYNGKGSLTSDIKLQEATSIVEYRIPLPMTVEEYQVAQLWSVAEASKNETGGGEGIEVLVNEPFDANHFCPVRDLKPCKVGEEKPTTGQFTHKIYHLSSKVPKFIKMLAPKGSLEIHEVAWNAYPYCRTIITNPEYMKENFFIQIETLHLPDQGDTENPHMLSAKELALRKIQHIDIANDPIKSADYKPEWDPKLVRSEKANRGPLNGEEWKKQVQPVMCCYKLVTAYFKWFGLQNRVEKFIQVQEKRIFTNFHRQVYCWMDKWYGLTMEDIRAIEERTKRELDEFRACGQIRGTSAEDDK